jgi:hypothetical protein
MCSSRTVDTEALAMLPKTVTLFDFQKAAHAGPMGTKNRLCPGPDSSAQVNGNVHCVLPIRHRKVDQL